MTKKMYRKALLLALAATAPMMVASQAHAQARAIGVVDDNKAVLDSNAFKTAMTQMQTTYKAQIDQLNARRTALQGELQPLINAYQTAAKAPNATEASVRPSAEALQKKNAAAEQELNRLSEPVALSRAYVLEQIAPKMDEAVRGAMRAKQVDLVVVPGATVAYQPAADITAAVTTELNRLVPSANIVPPAGWRPGQQQQAPAAPAQQPQGR
ncbi:OmpH family outer membrane protein [Sphingomonas sp. C3-2]|uniref:OmpH family outer membrane protein n=1 Tax=Sphingomonas sp. C3-2 TaxID=3062169 RepID=UPI00294B6993|nr:OmpH family outer membrane protein [Sphingomonas sp. C3-2]WOK36762.1 OmpH family outer membrane protein [Sphingomonas sp. C3-2]